MVQMMNDTEPTVGRTEETREALERLSWNYWWSWTPDGSSVFRDLGRELWDECEHNPRRVLQEVSEFDLMRMITDPVYEYTVAIGPVLTAYSEW